MSDLHEAAEAVRAKQRCDVDGCSFPEGHEGEHLDARTQPDQWTPPEGTVAVESDEQLIPGGPFSKVKRIVVHPVLRMVAEMALTCPRCKAEGADRDPRMIEHIARGGTINTTCNKCKLALSVIRPEENRVVLADGPIPEQKANLRRILDHGKGRRR